MRLGARPDDGLGKASLSTGRGRYEGEVNGERREKQTVSRRGEGKVLHWAESGGKEARKRSLGAKCRAGTPTAGREKRMWSEK